MAAPSRTITMITNVKRIRRRFFFIDTATTEIYTVMNTLSLHDALPISRRLRAARAARRGHRATVRAGRRTDPRRARLTAAAHRLGPVRDQRRDARRRRAAPHLRCGRAALRLHEGRDRAKLPAARDAGGLALARRGGVEPGGDRHARGPG